MHHPTDRITHTRAFVTPVMEHLLEREIAQWFHPMKDRSDDPPHHERMLLTVADCFYREVDRPARISAAEPLQAAGDSCPQQLLHRGHSDGGRQRSSADLFWRRVGVGE